jgi:hypothetical protein
MYISQDTLDVILLLIVMLGIYLYVRIITKFEGNKTFEIIYSWWKGLWILIFVAFTIYGVFYR